MGVPDALVIFAAASCLSDGWFRLVVGNGLWLYHRRLPPAATYKLHGDPAWPQSSIMLSAFRYGRPASVRDEAMARFGS